MSLAPILGHVIANLLLNRGETLNRKCRRSNRARCAQSSIENSFRRRGRGRATPSSSSRRDSLIARRYPQWRRFTLTGVSIWPITYYLTLSNCVEEMPKAALSGSARTKSGFSLYHEYSIFDYNIILTENIHDSLSSNSIKNWIRPKVNPMHRRWHTSGQ